MNKTGITLPYEEITGVIIPNIRADNGYAYVLTNRQRRN